MFDDKGMLTDRARGILFWFTISMIALLAIIAIITILRACGGLVSQVSPTLVISPSSLSREAPRSRGRPREAPLPRAASSLPVTSLATTLS